jgi:hypothetical protein
MRTKKEIETQIEKLKIVREKVPPVTLFQESNLDAIDAMIHVLRDNMNEDNIAEMWDPDENGSSQRLWDNAMMAYRWLHLEEDDLVDGDGWQSAVRGKK